MTRTVYLTRENELIWKEAEKVAMIQGISLSELAARAINDYITLHQPLAPHERAIMVRAW